MSLIIASEVPDAVPTHNGALPVPALVLPKPAFPVTLSPVRVPTVVREEFNTALPSVNAVPPPAKFTSSFPVPLTGPIVCAVGSAILTPLRVRILPFARSKFSEDTQVLYVIPPSVPFHLIDLSVVPLTMIPPSSAEPSEGPIASMVA